jgi:hypothetical protein
VLCWNEWLDPLPVASQRRPSAGIVTPRESGCHGDSRFSMGAGRFALPRQSNPSSGEILRTAAEFTPAGGQAGNSSAVDVRFGANRYSTSIRNSVDFADPTAVEGTGLTDYKNHTCLTNNARKHNERIHRKTFFRAVLGNRRCARQSIARERPMVVEQRLLRFVLLGRLLPVLRWIRLVLSRILSVLNRILSVLLRRVLPVFSWLLRVFGCVLSDDVLSLIGLLLVWSLLSVFVWRLWVPTGLLRAAV